MIPDKKTRDEWRKELYDHKPLLVTFSLELLNAVDDQEARMESMRRAVEKFIQQGHAAGRLALEIERGYSDLLKRPT